jgi:hypothetical protein
VSERSLIEPTVPWSLSDARTGFLTTTVGAGLLVWAWWETSGAAAVQDHTTWTAVGILAVTLIAAGNLFWVMSGRRAVRLRGAELVRKVEEVQLLARPIPRARSITVSPFVVVPGAGRFHRESCLLVRGKVVHRVPADVGQQDGLRPCEMCEP